MRDLLGGIYVGHGVYIRALHREKVSSNLRTGEHRATYVQSITRAMRTAMRHRKRTITIRRERVGGFYRVHRERRVAAAHMYVCAGVPRLWDTENYIRDDLISSRAREREETPLDEGNKAGGEARSRALP